MSIKLFELEQVFNEAAFPEVTFVPPREYSFLKSSFKSAGKHITISGPSGVGKTTLVKKMLQDLEVKQEDIIWNNGRSYAHLESAFMVLGQELKVAPAYQEVTPYLALVKLVIIDDFHHLTSSARAEFAKTLKLWHEQDIRFVIVGIASSAEELLGIDPELGIRNDPYKLGKQDDDFTLKLIDHGQNALNIKFSEELSREIVGAANGVPSIVQVICKNCCIHEGIDKTQPDLKIIDLKLKDLREAVLRVFTGKYFDKVVGLAKGKQQARSVHNTYFDIVAQIASETASEIPVESLYRKIVGSIKDPKQRSRKATSFYNCLKNLSDVIQEKGLAETILYSEGGNFISIEDPSFRFYLNLLNIDDVKRRIHVRSDEYPYDIAVSFAGDIRPRVQEFVEEVKRRGISVFYDFDQRAQLWGQDLRQKLSEVYATEAQFMVVFLSKSYPERDWTDFELAIGKAAADKRTSEYLLPVKVDDVEIVGLKTTTGFIDLRTMATTDAVSTLEEKIQSHSRQGE